MGKRADGQAKKLIDAAKRWAGWDEHPFDIDDGQIEALLALGCPVETLQAARVRRDAGVFEVWPENWDMFQVFCALGGQWRWVPGGLGPPLRDGINAPSIESVFRLMGVRKKDRKETYAALRLMEGAVLEVQNRKAARR